MDELCEEKSKKQIKGIVQHRGYISDWGINMPRKRKQYPYQRRQLRPPSGNQMMKGMVDVSKMAIGGAVMLGGISTVASIIKK